MSSIVAMAMHSLVALMGEAAAPAVPPIDGFSRIKDREAKRRYPRYGSKLERRLRRKLQLGRAGAF